MKRRSRGEEMLAAAGLVAPAGVAKRAQQAISDSKDEELKSPPAKRARPLARDDSPAKTSPRKGLQQEGSKTIENPVKLPAELELLASMFDALRTGRMMLKRRSEKVTYNSVRPVVENMTKREFRVEHLAQIKRLRPESFDWQYIRTPSAMNPSQTEVQLLLTFDRPASSAADGGSVGKYSGASELAEFRTRLEEYVKANPVDPMTGKLPPVPQAPLPLRPSASGLATSRSGSLPLGSLPSPSTSAGARLGAASGLLPAASCPPGLFPDVQAPGVPTVAASPSSSGMSGASPSLTRSRSRLGLPAGAVQPSLTPILEGGTPAAQQLQRKRSCGESNDQLEGDVLLEDDQEERRGQADTVQVAAEGPMVELTQREGSVTTTQRTGMGCAVVASTPQSKGPRPAGLQTTPTSQQQPAGLARLHSLLSPAAMQKILQAEAAQAAQTPEAKRRAEMRRAVQLLPHGHELVRHIFGLQGPTVKPLTQVAQAMCERSTQRQGLTAREASNTLVALARAVPEFLRIEDPRVMADGSSRPRSVVISRTANINAVSAKLKALTADPDAAVQSIFERGGGVATGGRDESPDRVVGAAAASVVPSSPTAHLRPRSLAQSLDGGSGPAASSGCREDGSARIDDRSSESNGAGSVATARGGTDTVLLGGPPPPTPSSRRRPPGLPLAPPSPMVVRGGQTPTRSAAALRSDRRPAAGGSILAAVQAAAPPAPVTVAAQVQDQAATEFLHKLCRTSVAAGGRKSPAPAGKDEGGASASGTGVATQGVDPDAREADGQELSGRTPGRGAAAGRTPGRTAVQEVMLNSIRRSSAKRSCRKLLDDEMDVEEGADDEAEPRPRRLEESLG